MKHLFSNYITGFESYMTANNALQKCYKNEEMLSIKVILSAPYLFMYLSQAFDTINHDFFSSQT